MNTISDGIYLVLKRECPTCLMIEPVVRTLATDNNIGRTIKCFVQDDPDYLNDLSQIRLDNKLKWSYLLGIETVPTLISYQGGQEVERSVGWVREEWRKLTGLKTLGESMPEYNPGCGSLSISPGAEETLRARFGKVPMQSRTVELQEFDDAIEEAYRRGWSDGLPVVPPTGERVLRMLEGTTLDPQTIVGRIPPNLTECTVEKVAINAVMAGCRPEYMPVVLASLNAALDPLFTLHGLLCTTCFSGPIIIVNGPITKEIGMNWGMNALGQGNRANSTIGRALQLVVRNVGGGIPGEIDRATLGSPGKIGFCFAEDETEPNWEPLSVSRGFKKNTSTVTLFPGDGVHGFGDSKSRQPEELTRSLAMSLQGCLHPKLAQVVYAMLVLSPEHYSIYKEAGWNRKRITDELMSATAKPSREMIRGALGVGEGIEPEQAMGMIPKFFEDGILIVRAGGQAGLFSGILTSWTGARDKDECKPVTKEIFK